MLQRIFGLTERYILYFQSNKCTNFVSYIFLVFIVLNKSVAWQGILPKMIFWCQAKTLYWAEQRHYNSHRADRRSRPDEVRRGKWLETKRKWIGLASWVEFDTNNFGVFILGVRMISSTHVSGYFLVFRCNNDAQIIIFYINLEGKTMLIYHDRLYIMIFYIIFFLVMNWSEAHWFTYWFVCSRNG
jgi:hypothetical protein